MFSYYSSKPRELGPIYFKRKPCCFHENIKTISKTIKNIKAKHVFIGWGNIDTIWQLKVVNKVLNILDNINIKNVQIQTISNKTFIPVPISDLKGFNKSNLTNGVSPLHGLYWK